MPNGYQPSEHTALLALLRDLPGVAIPDGARIGGPGDGWRWRVLDGRGREPSPPIRGRDSPLEAATAGVRVRQPGVREIREAALGLGPAQITIEAKADRCIY